MRKVCVAVALALLVGGCSAGGVAAPKQSTPTTSAPVPTVAEGPAQRLPRFPPAAAPPTLPTPSSTAQVQRFIAAVFNDAQQQWNRVFTDAGLTYQPARLVLFTSAVHTGCGTQSAKVGPFYCPADHGVYLDVSFFEQMARQFGVRGDFAQAYVVAHEVGHHIQVLTGVTAQVAHLSQSMPEAANALSVRTELQADCYAGVWAHSTYQRGLLEPGDIEEALHAAAVVGDDFQQRAATGTVQPENWTHGSSAQRQQWFTTGYQTGDPARCDTFTAPAQH
ncbi:MAG TPA: neutral zinc metallopeptidase [Pseudonocardiaceae bacterium]|nr:neutral zinc metallopeptidase [Pseudonocardiaceae bacterium]